jgi:hypothetical protein
MYVSHLPSALDLRLPYSGFYHCSRFIGRGADNSSSDPSVCRHRTMLCALAYALVEGDHSAAGWIVAVGRITAQTIRADNCNFLIGVAFRQKSWKGNLSALVWLTNTFLLTKSDFSCRRSQILRSACHTGNIDIAKWLVERFHLKVPRYERQLHKAGVYNRTEVVAWLTANRDIFKVPAFEKARR